jgi:malate dehydrogenase (quinone)
MLDLLAKAFPQEMAAGWQAHLKEIIPSYGLKINDSPALTNEIRGMTSQALNLPYLEVPAAPGDATPATTATPLPAATPAKPAEKSRNANAELQAL